MKLAVLSAMIGVAAADCQQNTSTQKQPGTYAAARHNQLGSNIPQPYSVDSAGKTYNPEQFSTMQARQTSVGGQPGGH